MPHRRSDASLVNAALSGDEAAFTELAHRYRDAAFGIAFCRLSDFEAARDVAQEALVRAYRDLAKLREPDRFGNWLYKITSAAAASHLRRRRVTVSIDDPDALAQPSPIPGPPEAAERSEQSRQVHEALAALSEPDRLAVILHYINGYSHEEIGGILDTTASAIKSRLHRARGRLKKEMQQMVEQSLKESVLERLDLPRLRFTVDYSLFDPEYAELLEIKVTEVFGSSPVAAIGGNYLVCGDYKLKEHKPQRLSRQNIDDMDQWLVERFGKDAAPQVIVLCLAITNASSTGYHCFLTPGSGTFDLYAHVKDIMPGQRDRLSIMINGDRNRITIHLD